MRSSQRGFGLVAVLIGIALAGIALIAWQQSTSRLQRLAIQDSSVKQHAQELRILTDAVRNYVDAKKAAWINGTRHVITVAELTSEGYLPAAFATRYNLGSGVSPYGQRYRAISIKADNTVPPVQPGTARTIVLEEGAAVAGALERVGITSDSSQILGLQKKVAVVANRDMQLITGVLGRGESIAEGVGGAFRKDLEPWLSGSAEAPFSVAFIGFPDLGGGDDDDDGPQGYPVGDCIVSGAQPGFPNLTTLVEQSCPIDYPINAGSWPHCRYPGGPISVALPLIGTAVTLVETTETLYELSYNDCERYAMANSGCTPSPTNFNDPCYQVIATAANSCLRNPSIYRRTSATLNSGNLSDPDVCYADRPFVDGANRLLSEHFQYSNPSARDMYCCKPPAQ